MTEPRSHDEDPGPTPPCRILLVEDNEAASEGLAKLLRVYGFDVVTAHNGASALASLDAGEPPHFLLTDMQLPDLDGREIALHARQLVPPPRVVLITGWDIELRPEDALISGIDWIFTKPLDFNELLGTLRAPDKPSVADFGASEDAV